MSNLLAASIGIMATKRSQRLQITSDRASIQTQSNIATPSGFNADTGVYIATTADGSEVQYAKGNFRNQPSLISVVSSQNSQIAFGDWQ
jgi:hypothetical protein